MPVYDYLCDRCGPLTEMRPMAECDLPLECPGCGFEAPRAYLTAPHFACLPSEVRRAHAINERSAQAPQRLTEWKTKHGASCWCCAGKSMRTLARGKNGAKSFPSSRPWMISH